MNSDDRKNLRFLPAVERVLNVPQVVSICAEFGRTTVTNWVRQILGDMRNGRPDDVSTDAEEVEALVVRRVSEVVRMVRVAVGLQLRA